MTRKSALLAYGLLIPALAVVGVFMAYPLYIALNLSLRAGRIMNFARIGEMPLTLANYAQVLTQSTIWRDVWLSLVYTLASTGFAFAIGLATALLLNQRFPGRRWLRTLVMLPWSVPGIVATVGFLWLLDSSYGVVNYLLRSAHLITSDLGWFADPRTAMVAVVLPTVWKGYPFFTLMLLAALQSIPVELYEAGQVDGAAPLSLFRHITWPGIRNTAYLALVLNGLWAFREFDFIYPTTGGGPAGATETLAIRIYNEAFSFFHLGSASALGVMTLLLAAAAVLAFFPLLKQEYL